MPETLSNLTDIISAVEQVTGQYGIATDADDQDALKRMVRYALDEYSSYIPYVKDETIYVQAGGQDFVDPAPDYVLSCEMCIYIGTIPDPLVYHYKRVQELDVGLPGKLWRYKKPTLYVPASADYEIREGFKYYLDSNSDVKPGDVPYSLFIDLLTARYLMQIGRRRRMVTFGDISVQLDGEQLVGEGQSLLDSTLQRLYDESVLYQTL